MLEVFVPDVDALAVGASKVFRFRRGRSTIEGFVMRNSQGFVAFANECPHWHVDLDLGTGDFWDPESARILCKNHGALFHPESGVCERGPCTGLSLERFEFALSGGGARVWVPDAESAT
ncbi:MAG: Rieske 2Fe-2S domain-containing protein [Polyangiaceae bacterium]